MAERILGKNEVGSSILPSGSNGINAGTEFDRAHPKSLLCSPVALREGETKGDLRSWLIRRKRDII